MVNSSAASLNLLDQAELHSFDYFCQFHATGQKQKPKARDLIDQFSSNKREES